MWVIFLIGVIIGVFIGVFIGNYLTRRKLKKIIKTEGKNYHLIIYNALLREELGKYLLLFQNEKTIMELIKINLEKSKILGNYLEEVVSKKVIEKDKKN